MMKEKVDRKDDEGLYQPKIHSKRIRALHEISEKLNISMTVIVDQALEAYIQITNEYFAKQKGVKNE